MKSYKSNKLFGSGAIFGGREVKGAPRKPISRSASQGLDQISKMEKVEPKVARLKGYQTVQKQVSQILQLMTAMCCKNSSSFILFSISRKTKEENCDQTMQRKSDGSQRTRGASSSEESEEIKWCKGLRESFMSPVDIMRVVLL